ncbi:MAG TPA: UDP-N-acetylmuramoyl-L-alanyl-D-glutamate--2,6-diaminopimelate ligase [Chloroflexota bacterium]|nr:UDP-N-acetylmuramoyl-L-alanyl-D-glutamate--2,6-diaminopimelate ligase [Chloroflexota bacterium]
MRLADLLREAGITPPRDFPDSLVGEVRYDSRAVGPGDLFVAVPGTVSDGHLHGQSAAAAGAVAAVVERPVTGPPFVVVPSTRLALADLAAARRGFPARGLHITGVTGTDGKTTSVYLLTHLLDGLGRKTGLLSTVAFKIGARWEDNMARQSTLEAPEVQAGLAAMVDAGVQDAVLEATSHGLALGRVRRCAFDEALITNITSEHLEFHGTRQEYIQAKALILDALLEHEGKEGPRFAAINRDDEGSASLIPRSPVAVVSFGLEAGATVRGVDIQSNASGSTFGVEVAGSTYQARTRLPGLFNVYNCLGALAVLHGRGVRLQEALPHLESFAGVPGRMRRVDLGQPFLVVVDYAHTAASLEKVLTTLRPLATARLIVVFGSAGDRDREKRPVMGAVAARLADFSVMTDEDPRSERSDEILDQIARGAMAEGAREGSDFLQIGDRKQAIHTAISMAGPGDVVLLAGKGHEHSMLVGGSSLPWDEEGEARAALLARGYGP